jgi:predicted ester cyclase
MGIAPTGRRVSGGGIAIARFKDGKHAEAWEFTNELNLLRQLGADRIPD